MLLDFLFPNRCLECNIIIDKNDIVCEICFQKINFTHHNFSKENTLGERCTLLFPLENAFSLMQFEEESLSRKIIHELKYKNREKIGEILAKWTIERFDFTTEKPNLIITVPLHPKKQKQRGYNQLHLYAETFAKHHNIPLDHNVLKRNFHSGAQALKKRQQRGENQNLFSVNKEVSEKHILIIDDVFTTGNTLSNIIWEILKYGEYKISILVMAID